MYILYYGGHKSNLKVGSIVEDKFGDRAYIIKGKRNLGYNKYLINNLAQHPKVENFELHGNKTVGLVKERGYNSNCTLNYGNLVNSNTN